jgi:ribosome-associated translation inhibitor RaiA
MKLNLQHRHHQSSPAFIALLKEQLDLLQLRIDEARVLVERRLEASPAFRVAAHLVTPGPDVFAEGVDHTLRAALQKTIAQLEARIDHRHLKRARRRQNHFKTASPAHLATASRS